MVAGATGMDAVIFVIAADDGVMPQTREHLDILTLLGITRGIVALTKADAVDDTRFQAVRTEIENFLLGTFLEGAPIIPLSSITGQGFGEFLDALKALVAQMKPKSTEGVFRMPIERTFSIKGYGTVASGIPVCGKASVGDEVVVLPQGEEGRIKAIQVYKHQSETVVCGQCAALNVPKWDHKSVGRGDVITIADYFAPSEWYLCRLTLLPSANIQLKTGAEVKFHTGTSEILATVYLMEGDRLSPGQAALVQLRLKTPVVAATNDRFIIRTLSPVNTAGGGRVIEALGGKLRRTHPGLLEDIKERADAVTDNVPFTEYCIRTAPNNAANVTQLSRRTKIQSPRLTPIIENLKNEAKILELAPGLYIHAETATRLEARLLQKIADFHRQSPQSPGLPPTDLLEASALEKPVFDALIARLLADKKLAERKNCLALPSHMETFSSEEQKLLDGIETLFRNRPFNPPSIDELTKATAAAPDKVKNALQILRQHGRIIWIEGDLLFHTDAVEEAKRRLIEYIKTNGPLESVKFKYLLDTSRKFAIPLLDYFDKIRLTRRQGYTRHLIT